MAEVIWPQEIVDELEHIGTYIGLSNPVAAEDILARLVEAGESLAHFPNRGRPASRGCRELVTVPPFVIRYAVSDDDVVTILSIRHGARRPE